MTHPPAALAETGRLNDAGAACFYAATRRETAIAEIHATEGQRVQLAGFRIRPKQAVRLAVIGEYANVQKRGYMFFGGRDPGGVVTQRLNGMNRSKAKCLLYIDRFFAPVLSDKNARENSYLQSRTLAKLIYKRNEAAGIVFPSVRDTGGFNVGIKPAVSIAAMHNVCCIVAEVNRPRQFGFVDFELISSASELTDCGSFFWGNDSNSNGRFSLYGLTKEESEIAASVTDNVNGLIEIVRPRSSDAKPQ